MIFYKHFLTFLLASLFALAAGDDNDSAIFPSKAGPPSHLWSRLSRSPRSPSRPKRDVPFPGGSKGHHGPTRHVRQLLQANGNGEEKDAGRDESPPVFNMKFEASVRVKNLQTGDIYLIHEQILDDSVTLRLNRSDVTGDGVNNNHGGWISDDVIGGQQQQQGEREERINICSYSRATGLGHKISGIDCTPTVNLPNNCFCRQGVGAFVPVYELLRSVTAFGTNQTEYSVDFRRFRKWQVDRIDLEVEAIFVEVGGRDLENDEGEDRWEPFALKVKHNVSKNAFSVDDLDRAASCQSVSLEYDLLSFRPLSTEDETRLRREAAWSPAPRGVFCPRPDTYRRQLPEIPEQFSVRIETIDELDSSVSYSEQSYDLPHSIVSFKFAPRSHSPPAIFFARFMMQSTSASSRLFAAKNVFNIVHDFNSQLEYTINQRSGNCSVERIPLTSPDAQLLESSQIKLKHAKELLDTDPSQFMFSGERWVRGILCDVWVAEKSTSLGYQTTELFFSRHDWNLFVEEVNAHQELPVGIATYTASSKNASRFENVLTSHYFEFNPSQPEWRNFDIGTCVPRKKRLFLKITLDISYTQLVQFSVRNAQDSLRKAISRLAQVSPLRIVDIHLTSARGERDGIDVWFVILEKIHVASTSSSSSSSPWSDGSSYQSRNGLMDVDDDDDDDFSYSRPRTLNMADAYRQLAKIVSQKEVTLRLKVAEEREQVAHIRRHSLQMASETTHPGLRNSRGSGSGYRFLRATYTAGSMAGLGFSMAILGICVGIFLGFLLWKRRIGMPYYLTASTP